MTSKNAINWRVQTAWQPGTVGNEAFLRFTKKIEAMTGGRFNIEPFQEGAIVGTFEMFDAVKNGVFQAMHGFPVYWAGKLPVAVFMTSFPLGPDEETHWEWFYGPGGGTELAREAYASQNLFWVGPIQHGPNLIHSKVPIRSFEDFAGKKIRYPGGMVSEVFSAAGVSTVLLPGGEIYPALEKSVIDAADYVGAAINWNLGFAEVTKYIILPSLHQPVDLMELVVNMKQWQSLSKELQELLIASVKWHSWDQWSAIHEADRSHYRKFEQAGTEIITLPPGEVQKFRKIAIPLWYKWAKKHPLATRAFKIWLDYMLDKGFINKEWIAGQTL
ncbi:MAG: TRAP transporter substrate-binding protein DctP [Proteobacteria bacterium]|nr:TRAP transporter substrate-binding protein DctP [Pseudomonadota bacterium]